MTSESQEVQRLKQEVKELKEKLAQSEELIKDISAPIIPSIIPETILIPITGRLTPERFEMIISKILDFSYGGDINTIIVDFSAISEKEIGEIDIFGTYIHNMANAIGLMGIETLFVGFTPALTQVMINSGVRELQGIKTFLTFRTALQYLMREKDMEFQKANQ
ncbi:MULTISPECIES: STAS domain-containing protein [Rossellomorea]|uniref:STAS domain-containing protein n=1 Tax=Rossellomorea TaxID=2837508 RepID=UPI001CCC80EA|nr:MULTISPECIES: STAS domain-containing protein [Rossellomorea]MCA0149193.1 STAS domain-containing protein [Rossellomorea vietnamensis]MCC5802839.1 STAS domain-containing protein [Rossellomorea vietnamensis]UTE78928.1 STAS domain-containing protein [Rossellomorea sp. KS-H15a]WGG46987.1 STAS domain-containing protein [Rossellomorea sp. DA94]